MQINPKLALLITHICANGKEVGYIRVLGAEGAGGAAEQLRQEAMVAAHAADGGLGGAQLAVAPHGN